MRPGITQLEEIYVNFLRTTAKQKTIYFRAVQPVVYTLKTPA